MRPSLALLTTALLLFGLSTLSPRPAHAGGFEYVAAGTRSLGRGGAFMARADDPMALGYNPAALAYLPGYQLMLGSNLAFYDACVQREGGYNDTGVAESSPFESRFGLGNDDWVNQDFPQVCRSGYPGPSPQLVFTAHPFPELGIGVGLLVPSGVGNAVWGDPEGAVDANGFSAPSPLRYALIRQDLLQIHPTIGFGVSPIPEIAFGLAFQWGVTVINFVNHANAASGFEDPSQDLRTQFNAVDPFVPVIIASVHVVPIDELDIAFTARISDSIDASGTATITTGYYGTSMPGSFTPMTTEVGGVNLRAGQPWQFGLSFRYSDRRERRYRDPEHAGRITRRIEDAMQNETFDLELDIVYLYNAPVADYVATLPSDATAGICDGDRTLEDCRENGPSLPAPLPDVLAIPHGWKDQISIRAGADWNVLPGQLAVRVGTHFETSGFNLRYHTHDTMPGMRLGLHAGATLRIDRFDISIAYAHIFQFAETISDGNYRMSAGMGSENVCTDEGGARYDPSMPVVSRNCYPSGRGSVVNEGTYYADFNIVSLDVRYHFE